MLEIAGITIKRGLALLGEIKELQDVLNFFRLAAQITFSSPVTGALAEI